MTGRGWQTGADIHKGHPLDLIPTIAPTQWLISTEHLWLRALIHAPCINGYINICIHVRLVSCNPFRDTRRWRVEALNPSEEGRRYDLFNQFFQHEFMSHSQLKIHPWTAQQFSIHIKLDSPCFCCYPEITGENDGEEREKWLQLDLIRCDREQMEFIEMDLKLTSQHT